MGAEILTAAVLEFVVLGIIHVRAPRRVLGVSPPMFAMRLAAAQAGPLVMGVGGREPELVAVSAWSLVH